MLNSHTLHKCYDSNWGRFREEIAPILSPCITSLINQLLTFSMWGPQITLFIPNCKAILFSYAYYYPPSILSPTPVFKTESLCLCCIAFSFPLLFFFFLFMAPLLPLIFFLMFSSNSAQGPPPPGYNPSSKISTVGFDQGFRNLWGLEHQNLDQGALTIWLDSSSGTQSDKTSCFSIL